MNLPARHANVPSPNRLRLGYDMPSSPIGYRNLQDDELVQVVARFLVEADHVNVNRVYLALQGTPWATARARIKRAWAPARIAAEAMAPPAVRSVQPTTPYVRVGEHEMANLAPRNDAEREAQAKDRADLEAAEAAPRSQCPSCTRTLRTVLGLEIGHYPTCPERQPA